MGNQAEEFRSYSSTWPISASVSDHPVASVILGKQIEASVLIAMWTLGFSINSLSPSLAQRLISDSAQRWRSWVVKSQEWTIRKQLYTQSCYRCCSHLSFHTGSIEYSHIPLLPWPLSPFYSYEQYNRRTSFLLTSVVRDINFKYFDILINFGGQLWKDKF